MTKRQLDRYKADYYAEVIHFGEFGYFSSCQYNPKDMRYHGVIDGEFRFSKSMKQMCQEFDEVVKEDRYAYLADELREYIKEHERNKAND